MSLENPAAIPDDESPAKSAPAALTAPEAAPSSLSAALLAERPGISAKADSIAADLAASNSTASSTEKKKTGRPPGKRDSTPRKPRGAAQTSTLGLAPEADQYAKAAAALVGTFTGTMQAIFDGEEWRPEPGEVENMTHAAAAVCRKYGIDDFPPVLGLIVAVAAYTLPRFARARTATKARGFMARYRAWREGREVKKPETPDDEK